MASNWATLLYWKSDAFADLFANSEEDSNTGTKHIATYRKKRSILCTTINRNKKQIRSFHCVTVFLETILGKTKKL